MLELVIERKFYYSPYLGGEIIYLVEVLEGGIVGT